MLSSTYPDKALFARTVAILKPRHADKQWGEGKLRLKLEKSPYNRLGRTLSVRTMRKQLKNCCYRS